MLSNCSSSRQPAESNQEWLLKSYVNQMSQSHTNTALSWRRLYLSRAKLKASSRTSALLSGFAMVAMVEIQLDEKVNESPMQGSANGTVSRSTSVEPVIPAPLLIVFGVCTTLLVTVHLVALMISTCILPNIEAVSNINTVSAVNESPHDEMRLCVEMAWICSTGLGILLFLAEIAILCWVKFYHINKDAAIASTVIVIPAGILFIIFSLTFYKKLMAHKYQRHWEGLQELDEMARELNNTSDRMNVV